MGKSYGQSSPKLYSCEILHRQIFSLEAIQQIQGNSYYTDEKIN